MRIKIYKGTEVRAVKEDRLARFLEQGWQTAQPVLEKPKPKVTVKARAEVKPVEEEYTQEDADWEAPLISMPTTKQGDE